VVVFYLQRSREYGEVISQTTNNKQQKTKNKKQKQKTKNKHC